MEQKKLTFAPQLKQPGTVLKRDPSEHPLRNQTSMRQESVTASQLSFNLGASNRRDSSDLMLGAGPRKNSSVLYDKQFSASTIECLFHSRWRFLSYLQIIIGLLAMAVNMYSHYPLFTCGLYLTDGVDWLWYGTWIGLLNVLCGLMGALANKRGIADGWHRWLRRSYFMLNCSLLPFANGIGITSYGITLSLYPLLCNPSLPQGFTVITAFITLCLLVLATLLNILLIVYQIIATMRCKCWICHPKNHGAAGYVRTT